MALNNRVAGGVLKGTATRDSSTHPWNVSYLFPFFSSHSLIYLGAGSGARFEALPVHAALKPLSPPPSIHHLPHALMPLPLPFCISQFPLPPQPTISDKHRACLLVSLRKPSTDPERCVKDFFLKMKKENQCKNQLALQVSRLPCSKLALNDSTV